MARVTVEEVKEIVETNLGNTSVQAFIKVGDLVVTNTLAGEGLSTESLKEITRWLSAHFVSIRDQHPEMIKIGEAEMRFRGKVGMRLDATMFGQQAQVLDTTGKLAKVGAIKTVIQIAHEVDNA